MRSAGKIATWTIGLGLLCYLAFDRFSRATELKAPLGARDVLRKLLSETSPSDVALLLLALACIAAATAGYWWPQLSTFFVAATTSKSATPPVVSPQAPPPGKPLRSSGPPEVMAPRHVGRPRPAGPAGPVPVLNADRQAPGDQSAPAGALLTGASLATRRRALSELGAHIDGPVAALLDLGLGLRAMRHDGQAAALLDAARGFRERLKICSAAQAGILAKYKGIDDVLALADWNYLADVMEPAIDAYVTALEGLPTTFEADRLAGLPAAGRLSLTIDNLRPWISDARGKIGVKRSEYDNAQVRR